VPIILHHHERYAGHGYPYGLRANEIPLGARIVAIADAYDAMINDRPYKRAISHEQAVAELRRHAGTQFDPQLVELFCDLYADRAPEPDETVVAMTAARTAHRHGPLILPDPASGRATRKRRVVSGPDGSAGAESLARPTAEQLVESQTMAPEGALGLAPEAGIPIARRPDSPSSLGRTDTAAG
jgi:hypothetical protein